MKLLLLLLLSLTSCCGKVGAENKLGPYPGKNTDPQICKDHWRSGNMINVNKCVKGLTTPKYKIGSWYKVPDKEPFIDCVGMIDSIGYSYIEGKDYIYYTASLICTEFANANIENTYLEIELDQIRKGKK